MICYYYFVITQWFLLAKNWNVNIDMDMFHKISIDYGNRSETLKLTLLVLTFDHNLRLIIILKIIKNSPTHSVSVFYSASCIVLYYTMYCELLILNVLVSVYCFYINHLLRTGFYFIHFPAWHVVKTFMSSQWLEIFFLNVFIKLNSLLKKQLQKQV